MMRPCSFSLEENEKVMQSSDYSVSKDFLNSYQNHIAAMEIVAECGKIYILNNYSKVKDWSRLNVVVEDNEKTVDYFNCEIEKRRLIPYKRSSNILDKIMRRHEAEDRERHNPITYLGECCLDTSDGDFSLKINNTNHLWISDESVIIIADYIEEQLRIDEKTIN